MKKQYHKQRFVAGVSLIIGLVLLTGLVAAAVTHVSIEAEDGALTGSLATFVDATAVGSRGIRYGASSQAPQYANDTWVFVGDSITVMSIWPPNLRNLVIAGDASRNPIITNNAIGGTGAGSWTDSNPDNGDIDAIMAASDAEFIPLALGTNDQHMYFEQEYEVLVQRVIAAGRTPVLPYIPWTNGWPVGHAENWINPAIERILARNPEALRGPDLFAITVNRPDLFRAPGDVHPNEAGQAAIQQAWANMMLTVDVQ